MKFAFSSNAFTTFPLSETIGLLAEIGYAGIEIMADVPHAFPAHLSKEAIANIGRALVENGLEISNINAFMHHADGDTYHPSWIEKDPALRKKRIEYTLACIDLAAALGARHLSTEPGGPLEGITEEQGLTWFREGLKAVEEKARQKGVRILIEPEPGLLIENSSQFLRFFEKLDPAVFGINFDIGHFFCVGEDPAALVKDLKDVIHHFHMEDIAASREHRHLMPGEGAIDLYGVFEAIDAIGYRDFVTVELYTYYRNPVEAARQAFEYIENWRKAIAGRAVGE